MQRSLFAVMVTVGLASSASATTIVVESDKLTYTIGETITLTVTGDSQGAKDTAIYGRLEYSAALTTTVTSSQTRHTYANGLGFAVTGNLARGDGFAEVFDQIITGGPNGRTVDQIQIATATLIADQPGVVSVIWSTSPGFELDFFGVTSAPGTAFCIGLPDTPCTVPEPGTSVLLALGLLGLAARRRRV